MIIIIMCACTSLSLVLCACAHRDYYYYMQLSMILCVGKTHARVHACTKDECMRANACVCMWEGIGMRVQVERRMHVYACARDACMLV